MQKQGGTLVKHYRDLAFMGFLEVVQNLKTILGNIKFCKKDILENKPDVLILVDYPGFNLRIAKFAKELGIKVQSNSGATSFDKGDIVSDLVVLECKTVMKEQKQVTLKKEWFTLIREEQFQMRKELSGVLFDFGDGDDFVAITLADFKRFLRLVEAELES